MEVHLKLTSLEKGFMSFKLEKRDIYPLGECRPTMRTVSFPMSDLSSDMQGKKTLILRFCFVAPMWLGRALKISRYMSAVQFAYGIQCGTYRRA